METYWVPGVNNHKRYGRWAFAEFTDAWEMAIRLRGEGGRTLQRNDRFGGGLAASTVPANGKKTQKTETQVNRSTDP